jgi:hypothetical protein
MKERGMETIQCPFCYFDQPMIYDFTTSSLFINCQTELKGYKLVETDNNLLKNIISNLTSTGDDRNLWFIDLFEVMDLSIEKELNEVEKILSNFKKDKIEIRLPKLSNY